MTLVLPLLAGPSALTVAVAVSLLFRTFKLEQRRTMILVTTSAFVLSGYLGYVYSDSHWYGIVIGLASFVMTGLAGAVLMIYIAGKANSRS